MIRTRIVEIMRARSAVAWCALVLVLAWNALFTPGFTALAFEHGRWFGALVDIAHRGAPVMLLALGQALVIGTGGVDLSVGSTMALASSVAAVILTATHLGGTVAIASGVAAGVAVGLFNGWLVGALRVQAIVATLVTLSLARGLAELVSGSGIRVFHRDDLHFLANGAFLGLPSSIWIAVSCFVVTSVVLAATTLRAHVEAIGDNERAARLAGHYVAATKCWVYAFAGLLAAVAGLAVCADVGAADASNTGRYLELDAILSVVIGGTSLAGGRFSIGGALAGALVNQTITTSLMMRGLGTEATLCVKALAVLCVVALGSPRIGAAWRRAWRIRDERRRARRFESS